jgi:FtsH-binding integral membrane protein
MRQGLKRHIYFAGAFAIGAFVFGWLVSDEGPFGEFFLNHVALPNIWRSLNVLPLIFGFLLGSGPDTPSALGGYLGFFIQWFLVGLLLSVLVFAYLEGRE